MPLSRGIVGSIPKRNIVVFAENCGWSLEVESESRSLVSLAVRVNGGLAAD